MKVLDTLRRKAFNWLAGDSVNGPAFGSSYGLTRYNSLSRLEANSVVTAVVQAVTRSIVEPPAGIVAEGQEKPDTVHKLVELVNNPQRFDQSGRLSGMALLQATVACRMVEGNAYWYKVRSGRTIIGLEFLRFDQARPKFNAWEPNVLTGYQVLSGSGVWQDVPTEDIVHFRVGINPNKPLEGMSPLNSCIREVCTDNEAVTFMSAIVRNPSAGIMMVPADPAVKITEADARMMAEYIRQISGGENAGKTIVPTVPMKAERFGLSPEEMALDKILRLPEQRITAVFGVPAIVVGLGAGLERSTFANFKEAREAFTETVLVPLWRELAETITTQLGPDFGLKPGQRFEYDISEVRALQEDVTALYTRTISAYKEGVLTLQESRQALSKDPEPQGDLKPAPVAPALPGKPDQPPVDPVGKAWVSEMAKKWQERASEFQAIP